MSQLAAYAKIGQYGIKRFRLYAPYNINNLKPECCFSSVAVMIPKVSQKSIPKADLKRNAKADPEKVTRTFVSVIKQITPAYQRRILLFLAKNKGKRFTNIEIAHALDEDRSNVWRFLNLLIEEGAEDAMIEKIIAGDSVRYSWKEPSMKIDGFALSELLSVLETLEKEAEKER
jgi:hypothetical protein